ncbi:hypothetical protein ACFPFV_07375 [Salinicoccus siamensis]|uniref:Integrase catalytic domain-containing protein n=1 Tax=Salinicoccus siamensis TaxID=381830 RepID=A0ABV5Z0P9_9STAP
MHRYISFYSNNKIKTKLKGIPSIDYRRHAFEEIA